MEHKGDLKAVFFDFDGTLFELKVDWEQVRADLINLFQPFGLTSNFDPISPSIRQLTTQYATRNGCKKAKELEEAARLILIQHELMGVEKGYPYEESKELLVWLKEREKKIAIITRNSRKCVGAVLEKYDWPKLDLIVCREDIKNEKPDPEGGFLAIEKLNISREACVIVGDTYHDIEMAKNLGVKSVLIINPRHKYHPIDQATYCIKKLDELKEIIF